MRGSRVVWLCTVATALWVGRMPAQAMPGSYRDVQVRKLEVERSLLLAMADSMPETLYRDRATPEQRDFAQQLHHAASAVVFFCQRYFGAAQVELPDTAVALNSRDGLRRYINAVYDYGIGTLRGQPADDRETAVEFFGGLQIPKWQIWDEVHLHTIWTAGQVVANFRKHGMAPPGFAFF